MSGKAFGKSSLKNLTLFGARIGVPSHKPRCRPAKHPRRGQLDYLSRPKDAKHLSKTGQKKNPKFSSFFLPILDLFWGPKRGDSGDPLFKVFRGGSGRPSSSTPGPIFASSRPVLAHLGALLAPSWPRLGTIWDPEGSTKQES